MTEVQYNRGLELARQKKTRIIAQICDDAGLTSEWLVSSSVRGEGYIVNRTHCTCNSHAMRGWCRHRAWLWYRLSKTSRFNLEFREEVIING